VLDTKTIFTGSQDEFHPANLHSGDLSTLHGRSKGPSVRWLVPDVEYMANHWSLRFILSHSIVFGTTVHETQRAVRVEECDAGLQPLPDRVQLLACLQGRIPLDVRIQLEL